jgi:dihydropyrimidinase
MRTLIRGGTVVNPTGPQPADVLIDGETIAGVLSPDLAAEVTADEVVDAAGCYVIPGGVDVHTHMEMPFGGTTASDTFETGTAAAAWGGTTTIIDFAIQTPGEPVPECLERWHQKAAGVCAIDYGFHMILGGVDDESLKAMDHLIDHEGVSSFKLFMAYPGVYYSDDGQILRAMQQAAGNGAVIMMHAENGIAIDVLAAQAVARGETAPIYHGLTRPAALEAEATHRAIVLAEVAGGAPLYIVHMSASEALAEVSAARSKGANVFAETCPQYLYLTLEDQLGARGPQGDSFEGAKWVCSTPLRSKHQPHAHDLWRGLRTDDLAVVSTDHCPFCFKDQKELGRGDFRKIPNGIGGVEHRMQLIYQGVAGGQLSLARWVETCATTPARMFGLYPRKGVIAPGSDADIVVYDPASRTTISVDTHHMNMDYSAYEGLEVAGSVRTVLSRGTRVIDAGRFLGRAGHGQYLPRGLSSYLRLFTRGGITRGFRRCLADHPAGRQGRGVRAAGGAQRL